VQWRKPSGEIGEIKRSQFLLDEKVFLVKFTTLDLSDAGEYAFWVTGWYDGSKLREYNTSGMFGMPTVDHPATFLVHNEEQGVNMLVVQGICIGLMLALCVGSILYLFKRNPGAQTNMSMQAT
jgi:hypothetical protein